jgi:hypothetical protein
MVRLFAHWLSRDGTQQLERFSKRQNCGVITGATPRPNASRGGAGGACGSHNGQLVSRYSLR